MTRIQTWILCAKVSLFALNDYSSNVAPYEKVSLFASNDHSSNFASCQKVCIFFASNNYEAKLGPFVKSLFFLQMTTKSN